MSKTPDGREISGRTCGIEGDFLPTIVTALIKVADHLTPEYRARVLAIRFCILSTVGLEGTEHTQRGDDGPLLVDLVVNTPVLPD